MHLIWFRHDLRTLDNLAFMGAMEAHQPCVAVYVYCPEQLEMQDEGPLRQAFHLSHVEALFKELKSMGIACIFEEVNQLADVPAAVESIVQAHNKENRKEKGARPRPDTPLVGQASALSTRRPSRSGQCARCVRLRTRLQRRAHNLRQTRYRRRD